MYTEIEKQLNEIVGNLKAELTAAKAIDAEGKATDTKKFNQILSEKITACNVVLAGTEKDGVTIDKYGANIAFNRISVLENMKKSGSIYPYMTWFNRDKERGIRIPRAEKTRKVNAFYSSLQRLLTKFRPTNSKEEER